MSAISVFSTLKNYQHLQDALSKVDNAIHEAQLAKQAGIPQADTMLSQAQTMRDSITRMINTYFPNGEVPAA